MVKLRFVKPSIRVQLPTATPSLLGQVWLRPLVLSQETVGSNPSASTIPQYSVKDTGLSVKQLSRLAWSVTRVRDHIILSSSAVVAFGC